MRGAPLLSLILSAVAFGGPPVQFCVGERTGSVSVCASKFAELPAEADGRLIVVDAVGNTSDWGLFCSWRGVQVAAPTDDDLELRACDEAKARLEDAAQTLTRAGLVAEAEWPRVVAESLSFVLLYPTRVLPVPRGEELVEGVYVPSSRAIHLTETLEGAPHEFFHAVLKVRGGSIDHDAFNPRVYALSRAFRSKYRGRPVL